MLTVNTWKFTQRIVGLTAISALALTVATPQTAEAGRGTIPVLFQITNNTEGDVERPRLRMREGLTLTFVSDGDVLGNGTSPGHREVYFHDVFAGTTQKVTTTFGGESYSASRKTDDIFTGGRPEYLTFTSTGEHGVGSSNPEGNPELFMWIPDTNTFHQLTFTGAGVVTDQAYPSDSGQCIVFRSSGDLHDNPGGVDGFVDTGFSNPDGSQEVFMLNMNEDEDFPNNRFTTQMSDGAAGTVSSEPSTGGYIFARQCQNTPFLSTADQFGDLTGNQGADMGMAHLYNFKKITGTTERMLNKTQGRRIIGDGFAGSGNYRHPHISSASQFARGPNVVFATDVDLWENEQEGFELFKYRAFHPRMTASSHVIGGGVFWPTVSDGGGWMTYASDGEVISPKRGATNGDPGPFNEDGNMEIFQIRTRKLVYQITETEGCENTDPHQMGSGEMIAFRSNCDLIPGENSTNTPQVFLYRKVRSSDPLASEAGCRVEDGCCNQANGCFNVLLGRQVRPPNRFCGDRKSGCRPKGLR